MLASNRDAGENADTLRRADSSMSSKPALEHRPRARLFAKLAEGFYTPLSSGCRVGYYRSPQRKCTVMNGNTLTQTRQTHKCNIQSSLTRILQWAGLKDDSHQLLLRRNQRRHADGSRSQPWFG
eukprot:GHVU01088549.1.p1 GENE.GHVU01088549.1~~GHVU01088549.1.p1  ORF type:complete len:124 (-),score=1.64 GHVU01088549.1:31-402(-)